MIGINKELVIEALNKVLMARNYPNNVIVHTDRGSQYASHKYKALLKQHNLIGSMSRKGNCWGIMQLQKTSLELLKKNTLII